MKRILKLTAAALLGALVVMLVFQDIVFFNSNTPLRLPFRLVAAELGFARSQFEAGHLYQNGSNIDADYAKALYWYQRAADNGYVAADYRIGYFYEHGIGVQPDDRQAFTWMSRAGAQDFAPADEDLCDMYRQGRGVAKDLQQAFYWCRKASATSPEGTFALGMLSLEGAKAAPDPVEAARLIKQGADQGSYAALKFLQDATARCHAGGGQVASPEQALQCYLAAVSGDAAAEDILGLQYSRGGLFRQDKSAATAWFRKAAEQGDLQGETLLGAAYARGDGVPADLVEGAAWLTLASENKSEEALSRTAEEALTAIKAKMPPGQRAAATERAASYRIDGIGQAVLAAGRADYRFYLYLNNAVPGGDPSLSAFNSFDVRCDRDFDRYINLTADQAAAAPALRGQQSDYNTALALMPDFPYPHLCRVAANAHTDGVRRDLLNRLHITEENWDARRRAIEASSIFTTAYFGHLDEFAQKFQRGTDRDDFCLTPLQYAFRAGNFEAFKFILEHGGKPDQSVCVRGAKDRFQPLSDWITSEAGSKPYADLLALYRTTPGGAILKTSAATAHEAIATATALRERAQKGDGDAQKELGRLYVQGLGVPQNNQEAWFWCSLSLAAGNTHAASAGNADDAACRDAAAARLAPAQVNALRQRVQDWRPLPPAP